MSITFEHRQTAHCENGVISNLLYHQGVEMTEPLAFGIGSGLFFVYLPFFKVNNAPAVSYRPMPGLIFKRLTRRLGIKIKKKKYKHEQEAQKELDRQLAKNNPVGLQVGVFNLPYFPEEYRFHFNAHNVVVFGKEGDRYLISDPTMEEVHLLTEKELETVRFAKGAFAPKGHMYYPTNFPKEADLEKAIIKGIKNTCRDMLVPAPLIGIKGMKKLAKDIRKWPTKIGLKKTNHYLMQMVRMQEEIGTGGGGFRFIFGAFLQEASPIIGKPELKELSLEITEIGDEWRLFAVNASRLFKNRNKENKGYNDLANQLNNIADREKAFFKKLQKAIK